MLPQVVKRPLQEHLKRVRQIHERDLAEGYGRVLMPYALARKYPNAAAEWRWQWVFPQENRWADSRVDSVIKSIHILAVALVLLVAEGCAHLKSTSQGPVDPSSATSIHARIRSQKSAYSVGEPLHLLLRIRNTSATPFNMIPVNPNTREVGTFTDDPTDSPRCLLFIFDGKRWIDTGKEIPFGTAQGLEPGNRIEIPFDLRPLDDTRKVLLNSGAYLLRGRYCWGWNASLRGETNAVKIVVEASGSE